jgi:tetratricopeptide (TPR) repeat protein
LREKVPFFFLAVVFGVIALAAQHEAGALRQVQQYFLSYRVAQAFYGISFYVWKTVLPVRLSPLYELPYDFDAWMPVFFVSAAAVTLISVAIYLMRQCWPALLACWAYYVVVLAPVLGIAQSGPQLVADRYSYLSCLSWAALAGGMFFNAWQTSYQNESRSMSSVALAALSLVVVSTLGIMTWKQTAAWHDPKTLWQHVLQVAPETSIAHYNLGRTYESEGNTLVAQELYRKALIINPTYSDAHYNLARLLARDGNQAKAIDHYREALKFKPNDSDARNNLGLLLAMRGDTRAALEEFRKAIEYDRKYAQAYFNLGRLLASQGDLLNAELNYREALVLDPQRAEIHFGLATVLARQGDLRAATEYFREAIQLKPDFAEAHTALARLLVAQGRTDEAEQSYREALRLLKE